MSMVLHNQSPSAIGTMALVLGISSSLIVSGIHLSSSLLTVPLLYTLPADTSTRIFSRLYRRSTKAVASLTALAATMFGLSAYCLSAGAGRGFSVALCHAAGLALATLLWARLAMARAARALLDGSEGVKLVDGVNQAEAGRLLRKWAWLNLLRGLLVFCGGLIAVVAVAARASFGTDYLAWS